MRSYRSEEACAIVGITYRQLDYWAKQNVIRPSINDTRALRLYSARDLLELSIVRQLLEAGVSFTLVKLVIAACHEIADDAWHGWLVFEPDVVHHVPDERALARLVPTLRSIFHTVALDPHAVHA